MTRPSARAMWMILGLLRNQAQPAGSVALDGVSLTVNNVAGAAFGVNVIPHTLAVTTLGKAAAGTKLNLEVDPLARYVSRQRDVEHEA